MCKALTIFVLLAPAVAAFHLPIISRGAPTFTSPGKPRTACIIAKSVVVTDMDETLVKQKSTGYIVKFLVRYRAYIRLTLCLWLAIFLIPVSKTGDRGRLFAVRCMYFLAFRGLRVDRAERVAAGDSFTTLYAADLQDPAASAVLDADEAVVLTASPEFMARPWLERYLNVPPANVYGAKLAIANGRYTGLLADELPIGQKKVELLDACPACVGPSVALIGYGDHPTDVPFLERCDRGVLVQELPSEQAGTCDYEAAKRFSSHPRFGSAISSALA